MAEHYWASKEFRKRFSDGACRRPSRHLSPLAKHRVAASFLFLGLVIVLWKNHTLNDELARQSEPRVDISIQSLLADQNATRGEAETVLVQPSTSAGYLIFELHVPDFMESYPRYDIDLTDEHKRRTLRQWAHVQQNAFQTFPVGVARNYLLTGAYAFHLYGSNGSKPRKMLATYRIQVPGILVQGEK